MANVSIKWDGNFENIVRRAVQPQMDQMAKDYQRMTERLGRQYAGRPASEIKPVLRREWRRVGGDLTDPELTEYAEILSSGGKIRFKA